MSKEKYNQCILEKIVPNGTQTQVSWIPKAFAIKNKVLKLRDPKFGDWEDGWKVTSVGTESDDVPDSHIAIKEHRKRTGDSLPKKEKK